MAKITKFNGPSFTSYLDEIEKDLERAELRAIKKAAVYAARKVRKNLGKRSPSKSGQYPGYKTQNLKKSIKTKHRITRHTGEHVSIVGSTAPHAHLLEFGHGDGKNNNKRPFLRRTLTEESREIQKILSDRWI